jgi:hypothetical protein
MGKLLIIFVIFFLFVLPRIIIWYDVNLLVPIGLILMGFFWTIILILIGLIIYNRYFND